MNFYLSRSSKPATLLPFNEPTSWQALPCSTQRTATLYWQVNRSVCKNPTRFTPPILFTSFYNFVPHLISLQ